MCPQPTALALAAASPLGGAGSVPQARGRRRGCGPLWRGEQAPLVSLAYRPPVAEWTPITIEHIEPVGEPTPDRVAVIFHLSSEPDLLRQRTVEDHNQSAGIHNG